MASPYEGLSYEDEKRWVVIYPSYINARKTVADGRRISKNKAVDNPTCNEMNDVLVSQGLNVKIEQHKQYPREWCRDHTYGGRVRVQVRDSQEQPVKEGLHTKKQLMLFLSEMIPKLKTRQPGYKGGGAEGGAGGQGGKSKGKGKRKK